MGETDDLLKRLDSHNRTKDFWNRVVVFTSKDDNLNKAHIRYLEARLVGLARAANRAELENSTGGAPPSLPSLSEPDTAEAEAFLDEMLLIYPVLGLHVFQKAEEQPSSSVRLHLVGKDTRAEGTETADGFVVHAGSLGRAESVPSIHDYGAQLRAALLDKGLFVVDGLHLRLMDDYVFASPSTAAMVLLGRTSNGRIEWKSSDGRTLKELHVRAAGHLILGFSDGLTVRPPGENGVMFDPVAELSVDVKELAAERRDGWSGAARSDRVLDVVGVGDRLEIERIRAVAEWDAAGAWALDGAATPVSWLTHRLPITSAEAKALVTVASLYHRHPSIAAAADGGEITAAHLRKMAWAEKNREDVFAISLDAILEAARELPSLAEFNEFLNEWVNLVDERGPADVSKRMLRSRNTFGGMASTDVWGPGDDAAVLRAALDLHDAPDPWDCPEGPRTKAQRDYDALFDILRLYLAGKLDGDADPAGGIDLNLDANTAAELLANPDDQLDLDTRNPLNDLLDPYRGGPDHDHAGTESDPCCEFTTGQKATLAFAAVMLCTGWVRRVTRDPHTGAPLDMGRRSRLFTRSQRRALIYRDRGCVFPGCDRPAKFCDAHHLKPWDEGGFTDLVNGVLLCRRHHTLVHQGWALARDAATGIVTVTAPDGRVFTRQPPRGRSPGRCTFEQRPSQHPPEREPARW